MIEKIEHKTKHQKLFMPLTIDVIVMEVFCYEVFIAYKNQELVKFSMN